MNFCSDDSECSTGGGICRLISQGCPGGDFWVGLCSGPENRRCCRVSSMIADHRKYKYGVRTLHAENVFR